MGNSWWKPLWHGQPGGSWRLVVFFLKTTLKAISGNKAPSQHLARAPGGAAQPGPAAPSPLPSRHVTVNIAITSPSPSRHCGCWSHQLLAAPSSWSHSSAHEPHLYTYIYTYAYICVHLFGRGTVEAKKHWLPGINPWGSRGRDLCSFPEVAKAR